MITIYKPPRRKSEESSPSSEIDSLIPAGTPYFTKVNGKLVMARSKRKDTATDIAIDLLGEAFGGPRTTIIRKRSKSVDQPIIPLLTTGAPNMTQQPVPYSAPMPQYAFPPQGVPQPMPMLQIPQYANQPPTFLPSPTEKDLNQLKRIDAHFNKLLGKQASRESMGHKEKLIEKVTEVKTTLTITKHVCANCGRLRSKKYHHDHPIKAGDQPAPAFCKKCQRDASSTSCSDRSSTTKEKKKKSKTNSKSKKHHHKKPVESSSEDEPSDSRAPKAKAKQKQQASKKKESKRKSSEDDYVIVEEEILEHENIRLRGRPRERSVVVEREYEYERRPPSPINVQPARHRARSATKVVRQEIPRKPVPPKVVEMREIVRERSPPIQYRYVDASTSRQHVDPTEEAQLRAEQVEIREESYPKKIPVRFEEDIVYRTVEAPRAYHRDQEMPPGRGTPSMEYSAEEPESAVKGLPTRDYRLEERSLTARHIVPRKPLSKQSSFEDHETEDSRRSVEARQRRRRERNSPTSLNIPPWEQPHAIHPRDGDEVIVVTERYEYRPKKKPEVLAEEERRTQEYVDRAAFYVRPDSPDRRVQSQPEPGYFSHEEAAKYYHDDWSRAEPGREQRHREPQRGYRRERHHDSELGDSEASYDYRTRAYVNIPRAPTPPSSFEASLVDSWQDPQEGLPYPLSSGSEGAATPRKTRAAAGQGAILSNPPNKRGRSASRHPHAYVREATDGGTERALIPSPKHSRSRSRGTGTYDDGFSDLTEKERIVEAQTRHVTFRETPSEREWTTSSNSGRTEAREHDLSTGGGSGW